MINTKHFVRSSALPAIAAALALSSTPVWAQEVQPATPDVTASQPALEADSSAPAALETTVDTTPVETATTTTTTTKIAKVTRMPTAKPVSTVSTMRTATTRVTAPVAAEAAVASSAPIAALAVAPPVGNTTATTTTTSTMVSAKPKKKDDTIPLAAGGALAFVALGGAAVAMTRRRGEDDEEAIEETTERDHADFVPRTDPIVDAEQPAIIAPSAFAWGAAKPSVRTAPEGESHVERAYAGPTSDNPSLSLRKRLKRAAFMDKREREAAAGLATPVDPTAGLPDRMVEAHQREPEFA